MPRISEDARRQRMVARDRVVWVLNNVFHGRQRRMADALGISQSQLSRIASGQLGPSPEILDAVARLPGINPEWVLHGEGEPLLPPTRGTLPVSPFVLPGPPLTCSHLLSGSRHMVAEALDRDTRYWLQVQDSWPLVKAVEWKISPGDLLLMETTHDWTGRLDLGLGRLCGVRVRPQSPTPYEVGRLEREGDGVVLMTGAMVARLVIPPPVAQPASPPPATEFGKRAKRRVLNLDREKKRAAERRKRKQEEEQRPHEQQEPVQVEDTFTINDIVAVCLYLARPMLASV